MTPSEQQASSEAPRNAQQGPGPPSQVSKHLRSTGGLSSHGASRKRMLGSEVDRSAYTAGQTLVTVVNDPRADASKGWGAWLGLGFKVPDISWQEPPPPIDSMRYPPVSHRDLAKYMSLLSEGRYQHFQQTRQSLALGGISQQLMMLGGEPGDLDDDDVAVYFPYGSQAGPSTLEPLPPDEAAQPGSSERGPDGGASAAPGGSQPRPVPPRLKQGDGLVTALQVVPALFFNEDFSLSRPEIFEAICGCEDDGEMYARIDKLNAALDVVETQLMREIASRSRVIVAAGNCVHDLHARLSSTLAHIKRLRENVSDMGDVTYSTAIRVAQLQRRRNNLTAAVEQSKALEEVAAAKAAFPLLLESGDYAGALELLDNLSHAAASLSASGVAALRGLGPQLGESREVVEALLRSEMLGAVMYTEAHLVLERAVAESAQALGIAATTTIAPLALTAAEANGGGGALTLSGAPAAAAAAPGHSLGLLPVPASAAVDGRPWSASSSETGAVGLRSASSSSLLAAELTAARDQLHDRLLPVVLGLHRCDQLGAALRQFAINRCAEVKAIVREVVERLLPLHLQMAGIAVDGPLPPPSGVVDGLAQGAAGGGAAAAAVMAAATVGGAGGGSDGAAVGGGMGAVEMSLAEKLCVLPHQGFLQIVMVISSMVQAYLAHTLLVGSLVEDILRGTRAAPPVLAAVRKEVASTLQALVDVATGRWAKLMAARSDVHSRLKVYEFRALLSASEVFAALPEQHGARPGPALRPTLQALCRAHLENTHSRCATQMQHLLEAEQWVPAEAHSSFQAIIDRMEARCTGATSTAQQPGVGAAAAQASESAAAAAGAGGGADGGRPATGLLQLAGRRYWPVNALLMLLKLLDEHYLGLLPTAPAPALGPAAAAPPPQRRLLSGTAAAAAPGVFPQGASGALSSLGPDVSQRCLELLRTFNTVTAQQVLGAGAMRTAGLKSISAKHLALAAQSLAALLAVLPLLRWQLAAAIAEAPRRALMMPEFDRLAQDLNLHVEEIHGKLVDIMQDRVHAVCRQVAAEAEAWPRATQQQQVAQAAQPAPSESLRQLARQLGTLRSVLQPILQPEEVSYIFGRVAAACSETLAALLDSLQPPVVAAPPPPQQPSGASGLLRGLGGGAAAAAAAATAAAAAAQASATAAWDASRRANALFVLQALTALPLDPSRSTSYVTRLATFYTKHYGLLPPDAQVRPGAPPPPPPPLVGPALAAADAGAAAVAAATTGSATATATPATATPAAAAADATGNPDRTEVRAAGGAFGAPLVDAPANELRAAAAAAASLPVAREGGGDLIAASGGGGRGGGQPDGEEPQVRPQEDVRGRGPGEEQEQQQAQEEQQQHVQPEAGLQGVGQEQQQHVQPEAGLQGVGQEQQQHVQPEVGLQGVGQEQQQQQHVQPEAGLQGVGQEQQQQQQREKMGESRGQQPHTEQEELQALDDRQPGLQRQQKDRGQQAQQQQRQRQQEEEQQEEQQEEGRLSVGTDGHDETLGAGVHITHGVNAPSGDGDGGGVATKGVGLQPAEQNAEAGGEGGGPGAETAGGEGGSSGGGGGGCGGVGFVAGAAEALGAPSGRPGGGGGSGEARASAAAGVAAAEASTATSAARRAMTSAPEEKEEGHARRPPDEGGMTCTTTEATAAVSALAVEPEAGSGAQAGLLREAGGPSGEDEKGPAEGVPVREGVSPELQEAAAAEGASSLGLRRPSAAAPGVAQGEAAATVEDPKGPLGLHPGDMPGCAAAAAAGVDDAVAEGSGVAAEVGEAAATTAAEVGEAAATTAAAAATTVQPPECAARRGGKAPGAEAGGRGGTVPVLVAASGDQAGGYNPHVSSGNWPSNPEDQGPELSPEPKTKPEAAVWLDPLAGLTVARGRDAWG